MTMRVLFIAAILPVAFGFAPVSTRTRWTMQMAAEGSASRREVLAAGGGIAALLSSPFAASAAKYGGFGYGSPEVVEPTSGIVDKSVLETSSVQASLRAVYGYLETVKEIEAKMDKDDQSDVRKLVSVFEFSKLRANLNTVNSALDEDTQRGTDRLIRATIQDITEIDTASIVKPGIPRSERKVAIIKAKLAKLDAAFTDFLKFFPKPKAAAKVVVEAPPPAEAAPAAPVAE